MRAAARALPLATDYLPKGTPLEGLRDWNARAILDLEATGRYDAGRSLFPTFQTRLTLSEGQLELPQVTDPTTRRVDDVRLEVRTDFRPTPNQALWDLEAWGGVAKLTSRWRGEPAEAWMLLGEDTSPGQLAEGWLHLPALSATPELEQLTDAPIWKDILAQFRPVGTAGSVAGDARPRELDARGRDRPRRGALPESARRGRHLARVPRARRQDDGVYARRASRCASTTSRATSSTPSIPVSRCPSRWASSSCRAVRRRGPSSSRASSTRGRAGSSRRTHQAGRASGSSSSAPRARSSTSAPTSSRASTGSPAVIPPEDILERYEPRGGKIDFDLGLWHNAAAPGLATQLGIDLDGMDARWSEFPLQLTDTRGHVGVWFDGTRPEAGSAGWAVDVQALAESAASRHPAQVRSLSRGCGRGAGRDGSGAGLPHGGRRQGA